MTIKMTYIKKGSGNHEKFYAAIFNGNPENLTPKPYHK